MRVSSLERLLERWLEPFTDRWVRPRRLQPWRDAACLADLGELTARWLEGSVLEQPAYYGPVDVDEDMAPGLTAALITANRTGLVTENSQAGCDEVEDDGSTWRQLAWVSGWATPGLVQYLASAAESRDDVEVVAFTRLPDHESAGAARVRTEDELVVTWSDGQPFTVDGPRGQGDYHWLYEGLVRPSALAELDAAVQVAVVDPVPGRNTLWDWLERTLRHVHASPTPVSEHLAPPRPMPAATSGPDSAQPAHRGRGTAAAVCESCRRRPATAQVAADGVAPFAVCGGCAPPRPAQPSSTPTAAPARPVTAVPGSLRLPRQGADVVRTSSGLAVSTGRPAAGFHGRGPR
ncbi:hypothetical protein [Kineosporia sp. A_224]|uniref:DUF6919 domain-containing protein n=1 Tax=Kineosporia sp. A_224 TaxID=1962180 RepID=UPI001E30B7BB|nr:hypothetical protein [Kineosporia sp. A_224]